MDESAIMLFGLPTVLKKALSRQNSVLSTLDAHLFKESEFLPQPTHENPNPVNYFNFSAWNEMQDKALYRATVATGWNGRKTDSVKQSDFFVGHRLIRFRRNQLILRDSILKQLGDELTKIGSRYSASFAVSIVAAEELPSIQELDDLERRLELEQIDFAELVDCCLKN
ncbi:hypothetical protein [Maricaulis sp.]|uniref:hypothetical protein n=1 Tax=Maricaulis sp. TaxID=1486257 RepID=UPI002603C724|nr:hypothetical protein [Maricaulis sp.]